MNKLNCVAFAFVIGLTAACEDTTAPPQAAEPAEVTAEAPPPPALSAAAATRVAVVVEDALTRLVRADGAAGTGLEERLRELAAMLLTADAPALDRQIEQTLRSLDAQIMNNAEADAVRLALALVAEAADGGVDNGPR